MTYGQATADNWSGGTATAGTGNTGFSVTYRSTDANGVATYDVTSDDNGYGTQTLRVLAPTHPTAGVPHSFLYVLPVEAGLGTTYGDGITTLESLDAEDQYNLTIVEPSFAIEPWYADNPNDSNLHYETFMTNELVPWVTQNLSTTGHEQNWLIGFSKSGIGGQDLLLKHPDLFTLAASWDFPADMSSVRPVRLELGEQLRHRRELPGQLPPDADLRRCSQAALPEQQPDLDRRLLGVPDRHVGLRRPAHLRRHRPLDRDADADAAPLGQRLGPDRTGRAEPGQSEPDRVSVARGPARNRPESVSRPEAPVEPTR